MKTPALDRLGKELKVGQTVAYPETTSMLGIDTIKSIGPKSVTLSESAWGGFTRRSHNQVVIIKEVPMVCTCNGVNERCSSCPEVTQ